MGEPIGWGIVGFGWVARDFMAPAIRAAGHRLVAVCDPGADARAAAADLGARAHADLAGLMAEPEVEAVYVATPNHLHRGAVEALAESGKAILCEKPMAAALEDAEAMEAAVSRTGVLYGTAFDQRHHPAHRLLRDEIRAGRVGTVTAIRIVYACWLDRGWTAIPGQQNWRIDQAQAGGGALMDLAPHGLDLTDFLLDEPILDVTALTQARAQDYAVDDGALLIGRTGSGVLASLHVAYNCPDALPRRRLEIAGTKGLLVAQNTMGQEAGGTVSFIDGATGGAASLPFDTEASPFLEQVRAFGRSLRDPAGRDAWSAGRDLHTMRLLARAYAASPAHHPGYRPARSPVAPAA
ncbi:Gfo/Idh/MocA family oxidoreductase [Methylobacterium terricola]|uniref:Gfo/Idh/MocA family oxidoreductase n=1 Tax=Methylobacterium terricola TaxID=2583531 RepID=A0A5C4LNW9_9HYPH|nr:Gfo/Idh/MocA family oxidoreductase [Methylobacterium terricola]TNC14319.1 Gfo/Idh/MocA family oxidoreductase [Methylobacterium terricola]